MNLASCLLVVMGLLALPTVASATGGTWCDAEDANLSFHFKAVQSRDGTGHWFGIEGQVVTKFGALPSHLSRFEIKDENLTQRWLGLEGVLVQVQKYDSEPFAAVMLTVVTKPVEEGVYEGTYALRINAVEGDEAYITRNGKVSCGAD